MTMPVREVLACQGSPGKRCITKLSLKPEYALTCPGGRKTGESGELLAGDINRFARHFTAVAEIAVSWA